MVPPTAQDLIRVVKKTNFVMDSLLSQQNYPFIIVTATIILGIVSTFYLFLFKSKAAKKRIAPQAGGAWPILGHFNLFAGGSQLPHIILGELADEYGPIFTIRLGIRRLLVVSSSEILKEVFTINDAIISSRPKYLASQHLSYDYTMFGLTPYGPFWRDMRKLISLELLSARRLELLKHVRVSELDASIQEIYKLWADNRQRNGQDKVLVEMKNWFGNLNLNVVLQMVVGKKYSGATNAKDAEEAKHCRKVMRDFFRYLGMMVVADTLPLLRWFDIGGHEKAMKETAKEMDRIAERWLEEHRRKSDCSTGNQDFMDVLLSTVQSGGFHGVDAYTIIKSTSVVLIASSADTTTVVLTWALSLLLNNRQALKKVQEELDLIVGRDRQVDESDLSNLVYLQAAVKEMLRLYPAGVFGGPREISEDCTIGGYHVKKGTWLVPNLWKLHRDPETWSNPSEFMPERFLNSNKNIDVKGQHFELLPFGSGRRFCPGISLALPTLQHVLATLLHNFDISTEGDAPVDMTQSAGMTNEKATPLQVLLSPRLPAAQNVY